MIIYKKKVNLDAIGKKIKRSDPSAFRYFFDELYPSVFRRASQFLKNYENAEDATQEVFMHLWRQRLKWCPESGDFVGWFLRLAERKIIDVYRHLNRKCVVSGVPMDVPPETATQDEHRLIFAAYHPDPQINVLDALIIEESVQQIEEALLDLTANYRLAFILYYFEGYTMHEVARIMACTPGAARIRVHRARIRIKEQLFSSQKI